jgi:hypothetical protein
MIKMDKRKIAPDDKGLCGIDCPYLHNVYDKTAYCRLYQRELHGVDGKTRCGECYFDEKP